MDEKEMIRRSQQRSRQLRAARERTMQSWSAIIAEINADLAVKELKRELRAAESRVRAKANARKQSLVSDEEMARRRKRMEPAWAQIRRAEALHRELAARFDPLYDALRPEGKTQTLDVSVRDLPLSRDDARMFLTSLYALPFGGENEDAMPEEDY